MNWVDVHLFTLHPVLLALFLIIITFIVTAQRWGKIIIKPVQFTDCQSVVIDEKTGLRASVRKLTVTDIEKLKSPFDVFKRGLEKSKDKFCFGTRQSFTSPIQWTTYEEVYEKIQLLGSGLTVLMEGNSVKNFVGIYGRNSPEWVMTQFANAAYSLVTIPLYSTFSDEAIVHVCNETELKIIACDTVSQACHLFKITSQEIEVFIIMKPDNTFESIKKELSDKVHMFTFEEILEKGRCHRLPVKVPDDNDLFMILYTSGTLGLPKGAMITNKAYLNSMLLTISLTEENHFETENLSHVSFLPLSHVMEQLTISMSLFSGGRIGFLTTDIHSLFNDLRDFKPSFFCSVPRLLVRLYTNFTKKIRSKPLTWRMCQYAMNKRIEEQKHGIYRRSGIIDYLFFREFRELLGGRVEAIISGSSPIERDVLFFIRAVLGCPVIEAYGSTETLGLVTTTMFEDIDAGHVGAIVPGVQVKLIDVPEMNLFVSKDKMGEICIRSKSSMIGYYKNEEKTREAIDSEGFVHSGDIGVWTENGALKIVDRTKNLFKLSQGEYVAPEKVEQAYLFCNLIQQIYVEGHPLRSYAVAVIKPNFTDLRKEAADIIRELDRTSLISIENKCETKENERLLKGITNAELCARKEIRKFILERMNKIGREKGLKGFELAHNIYLTPESFTVNNGLLTPTLKLARTKLRKHFSTTIKNLYEEEELVKYFR
ncbi:Long-chain-fatty-acid--CoA ligase 5 [Schistosoma japonicum]|nr:Long-chain-fatty-acid--CoA ligase 5 [Schistosoma japonicum]